MQSVAYARAPGDVHIAYQVFGEPGGVDVVMVSGAFFPMEVFPEDRLVRRLLDGLTELGQLVVFDKRGIGMSDPYTDWDRPSMDQWSDDLIAVIETTALDEPVVFAWDSFGVGRTAAVKRPDLLGKLVLFNPVSRLDPSQAARTAQNIQDNIEGASSFERLVLPSRFNEPTFAGWIKRAGRLGASPATASRLWQEIFVTEVDPGPVTVPTLVIHRSESLVPRETAVSVADQIEGAVFVELPGADVYPIAGDVDAVLAEVASFATGAVHVPAPERVVAAVLFTDLVGSTEQAADVGDARWRSLLDHHDETVRRTVGRFGGRVVKYIGDGVLAVLPSASGALQAAQVIASDLEADDLLVRAGVHVGEVDERGEDVSGIAVNIAARIMDRAGKGEILVSESVRLATAGSGLAFDSSADVELKGIPGAWTVHRWTGEG